MIVSRLARRLGVALVLAGAPLATANAQGVDCEALRQAMAAVTRPDPSRDARFARAIEQQRSELARTQNYSDEIGCGGFNLFGSAPAQCDAIENRVNRMQTNLDSLEAQARTLRNGDPDRAQDLAARYDASCRTAPGQDDVAITTDPGFMPDDGSPPADDGTGRRPQGGDKAICVRTCDGGFFPLGSAVQNDALDGLQALCSAQCPNTEAKLYTTRDTDNISDAVALDGTPYTALPAAFRFEKTHDASCTCKPAGQTWVQALARAEDLLDKTDTGDVTVTEKMSADMARPSRPTPPAAKKTAKRKGAGFDLPLPPPVIDDGRLGALAAQAPTASTASAGIATGGSTAAPTVPADTGAVRTVPGPDGTTRRVRIIGPGL